MLTIEAFAHYMRGAVTLFFFFWCFARPSSFLRSSSVAAPLRRPSKQRTDEVSLRPFRDDSLTILLVIVEDAKRMVRETL